MENLEYSGQKKLRKSILACIYFYAHKSNGGFNGQLSIEKATAPF